MNTQINLSVNDKILKAKKEYVQNLVLQCLIFAILLWQTLSQDKALREMWISKYKAIVYFAIIDLTMYIMTIMLYVTARFRVT